MVAALSLRSLFDGFLLAKEADGVRPRTLEAYGRSSVVTGDYGTGQEYGGGVNWYLKKSRQARLSLEALSILRSPAQNILYPYRAGYSGTAIQTQLLVAF